MAAQASSTQRKQARKAASRRPDPDTDDGRLLQVSLQGDREISSRKDDRLETQHLAAGLATILDSQATDTPLTVAVSAPWGAGKSSLIGMVKEELDERTALSGRAPHIVVSFNAWMHDGADDLSAALAAEVARRVNKHRSLRNRVLRPFPAVLLSPRQRAHRRQLTFSISLLLAIPLALLFGEEVQPEQALPEKLDALLGGLAATTLAFVIAFHALTSQLVAGLAALVTFVDDPGSASASGAMRDVAEELRRLIGQARVGASARKATELPRVIVVVDDLERCQPPKAIDMCDVAAQLLNHRGVVTILVGDLRVIAVSAELRYRDAAERMRGTGGNAADGWSAFGQSYLEKVVQFQVELPPLALHRLQALAHDVPASQERVDLGRPSVWRRTYDRLLAWAQHPFGRRTFARLVRRLDQRERLLKLLRWLSGRRGLAIGAFILVMAVASVPAVVFGPTISQIIVLLVGVIIVSVFVIELALTGRHGEAMEVLRERLIEDRVEHRTRSSFGAEAPDPARWQREIYEEVTAALRTVHPRATVPASGFDDQTYALIDEAIQRALSESSKVRQKAEAACEPFLPELPRTTKRLMNGLRFLIVVASKRQLLVDTPVTPEHLGRWMVFRTRWPRIAAAVDRKPGMLVSLERTPQRTLASLGLEIDDIDRLEQFLRRGPRLGPLVHYLVYLDPDAPRPAPFKLPPARRPATATGDGKATQASRR